MYWIAISMTKLMITTCGKNKLLAKRGYMNPVVKKIFGVYIKEHSEASPCHPRFQKPPEGHQRQNLLRTKLSVIDDETFKIIWSI